MSIDRRNFLRTLGSVSTFGLLVPAAETRQKLPRKDSFFGIHLDLHPRRDDTALGRDLTEEMVERFLVRVKPDYVQYDCKGHAGYLGYPSKVGPSSPGIVKDSLAIWRKVTERHGVALFIHFSGVFDSAAVAEHPEWARRAPDGKVDDRNTSTFGPYVDQRMIPQLKEAAERYSLDGAWIDGECWSVQPDYSDAAASAFLKATGISKLPRDPKEPGWQEFLEFQRESFRKYVRHYVTELHKFRPNFQIASNWLYTTFVPERPELPVDFISGDYLGNASVSTARLEARYLCQTGKPWDLMAWGFQQGASNAVGHVHKPAVVLQQEASVVLAQGGGFQVYYQPTRAGKIDDRHIEVMGRLAEFCRARQAFCHKSEPVPEIGVLFSGHSLYRTVNKMFGGWGSATNPARGFVDALVECHYSVDVLPDWKLDEVIKAYRLMVVPEWKDIGDAATATLLQYVRDGGKLLVAGAENAKRFAPELGVTLTGNPSDQPSWVAGKEVLGNVRGVWQKVEVQTATVLEQRYPAMDTTRDGTPAATHSRVGKGEIVMVYGPLGSIFAQTHAPEVREFVRRLVKPVFQPRFEIEGPPVVEASLRRKNGRHYLHLNNFAGMQVAGDYSATDFIPPVGPLRVILRFDRQPQNVTLEPGGRRLTVQRSESGWAIFVPKLEIHSAIAFTV